MIECELTFSRKDPKNPAHSFEEIDYYASIPPAAEEAGERNHRLSLRKNLQTGQFEVYRHFFVSVIESHRERDGSGCAFSGGLDTGEEEVAFEGQFEEALHFACAERERLLGEREFDVPCAHGPHRAVDCPRGEKT